MLLCRENEKPAALRPRGVEELRSTLRKLDSLNTQSTLPNEPPAPLTNKVNNVCTFNKIGSCGTSCWQSRRMS